MHTYFITRGIMETRNRWVTHMQGVKLPFKFKNLETGKQETKMVGLALRPVELWEVVHPKECLPEVLAMQRTSDGTNSVINACNELRPEIKNYALLMQKLMGLKPFPKFENVTTYGYKAEKDGEPLPVNWVPINGFAVYPIGIKEDVEQEYPEYGTFQEGL